MLRGIWRGRGIPGRGLCLNRRGVGAGESLNVEILSLLRMESIL